MRGLYKFSLISSVLFIFMLLLEPARTHAQDVPFFFEVTPKHQNGRITYNLEFFSEVSWPMTGLIFHVPLPAGTRFVEAGAQPTTQVEFDGVEVRFSTPVLPAHETITVASFVVEVIDPDQTNFTTKIWIEWQGEQPGNYIKDNVTIDTMGQTLDWSGSRPPRLQLEATATIVDQVITYQLYPKNLNWRRIWDVRINIPIPEGTKFLSVEAPPTFTTEFDGQEVYFSTIELPQNTLIEPLKVHVRVTDFTRPVVLTHAWVSWKNVGWGIGIKDVIQEQYRTGDLIVQPQTSQWAMADLVGDVPFPTYDITNLALQTDSAGLKIIFYAAGDLGLVGQPIEYILYIDRDCQNSTGQRKRGFGFDYRVGYDHRRGRMYMVTWDNELSRWVWGNPVSLSGQVSGNSVAIWLPYEFLGDTTQVCWFGESINDTQLFSPSPPADVIPNRNTPELTRYKIENIPTTGTTPLPSSTSVPTAPTPPAINTLIDVGAVWQYLPGWSEPPAAWSTLDFEASDWFSGPSSIGYGERDYATDLRLVHNNNSNNQPSLVQQTDEQSGLVLAVLTAGDDAASVFLRHTFNITEPASVSRLMLDIKYKAGFVAYLNGSEIARRGLGEPDTPVFYNSLATDPSTDQVALNWEAIDLSSAIPRLIPGPNVLTMQVHRAAHGTELYVAPKLTWQASPVNQTSTNLTAPTPTPPPPAPIPSISKITGKLAVPLDNGRVLYDMYIFALPDGQEITKILNARQPNFQSGGQRLLINREGGGIENVFEYNMIDGTEKQVSDAPRDAHPFYDPWGNRVVYDNAELIVGSQGPGYSFMFVQCSLLPPHQEIEQHCRDIPSFGVLVPAGQMGDIQGSNPVWTTNDMIAFRGCNTWSGSQLCGIYSVPSASTKRASNGFIPDQLSHDSSDTPSDTKGNLIAFTSWRDGNWEAYVMSLNGTNPKNLSNNATANDGLPTISPDGNWVAFVSDRGGAWAIWVVAVAGGPARKLFDLPAAMPWGDGDRAWTNERISWGP